MYFFKFSYLKNTSRECNHLSHLLGMLNCAFHMAFKAAIEDLYASSKSGCLWLKVLNCAMKGQRRELSVWAGFLMKQGVQETG